MTKSKDFQIFKTECLKWLKKFELSHWTIQFFHEKLNGSAARVRVLSSDSIATIYLSTDIQEDDYCGRMTKTEYLKECAKHEVIHILIGRYVGRAESRWCSEKEIEEAEEELVRKLMKIT
jgi:hypothetical protein